MAGDGAASPTRSVLELLDGELETDRPGHLRNVRQRKTRHVSPRGEQRRVERREMGVRGGDAERGHRVGNGDPVGCAAGVRRGKVEDVAVGVETGDLRQRHGREHEHVRAAVVDVLLRGGGACGGGQQHEGLGVRGGGLAVVQHGVGGESELLALPAALLGHATKPVARAGELLYVARQRCHERVGVRHGGAARRVAMGRGRGRGWAGGKGIWGYGGRGRGKGRRGGGGGGFGREEGEEGGEGCWSRNGRMG
ncbi:leucine-rich repeat extensin-like protein [Gracilaria domingensis]|nr:leucine-rich repeat extensin-like protein [Gracilaria domingensis]